MFFQLYDPLDEKEASLLNVLQLAYIGDAVWEIVIRNRLIRQGYNLRHIHSECISCGACAAQCPVSAISEGDGKYVIDADTCIECGACAETCPVGAPAQE